ncbi:MAG: LON peptidase substrate-binding domain-containing protein [Burkholderiaceae bacterium]|nr:LON peptidase substrate-binding domain-containing protein [Ideonella sp.]MCC7285310.1 LON peptidase substrate-binding domain-containing protein [Burkholderiaceae bacterium]
MPLFPLHSVLFPGARLQLRVFEARYLDLVSRCLREQQAFGAICLRQGSEVRGDEPVLLESTGVLARIEEVDAEQAGVLRVRCLGEQRFEIDEPVQQADGLWSARAWLIDDDAVLAPPEAMVATVRALANAIGALERKGGSPFPQPYRFDDAGWIANRWCELLPISLAAKQKLMALEDPQMRLRLVDEYLRGKGVISA